MQYKSNYESNSNDSSIRSIGSIRSINSTSHMKTCMYIGRVTGEGASMELNYIKFGM